ncbi:uncharacterized protein E0L32_002091 [Thyridium curvatum]|uniref:N-acetyltransferase domain-containing protein n=1 Tax=Thyridium curvatum TaxID=1093900 RepID=A0A507ARI7_9PEZI|nr:uncharacterized protein E0L32_002042 [Thyridium curvatum]XP_030989199.1 uncharacterized protein E0L32_002091 [Thyridium curvatum]TPX07439.1 hypothetical protein E0L32_002042 [Thyridium curvatum]TPX07488.1 hypothetical protein E0L32_002091 [Thyridium curvatum]
MPNPPPQDLVIRQAISVSDIDAATSCFRAYTEWLNMDLAFQDFGTEISTLPGKYAAPKGALLLACDPCSQEVLGCIAMRPLDLQPEFRTKRRADAKYCELKRLYVYPSARGRNIARRLVVEALRAAKDQGYNEALLDTLESMTAAISLYRSLGFEETERYYPNHGQGFINMSKKIHQ